MTGTYKNTPTGHAYNDGQVVVAIDDQGNGEFLATVTVTAEEHVTNLRGVGTKRQLLKTVNELLSPDYRLVVAE